MNCEKCGETVKRTLADKVGMLGRYKTVAYYCDSCDEIFILDKYKQSIPKEKFDGELGWLREQNPHLSSPDR